MSIELKKAGVEDAQQLWNMQVKSFKRLLDKYHDYDTNPANEPVEKLIYRLKQESTHYYFICDGAVKVGAVRIVVDSQSPKKHISPLFVLPEYQNRGIAQETIKILESIYGNCNWELDTILQEKGNCHLYEKMGYHKTEKTTAINDRLTLVFYEK